MKKILKAGLISVVASGAMVGSFAQTGPIKIGIVHPFTGPLSTPGKQATNGFLAYFKSIDNKVGGREIKFIQLDTMARPAAGLERVKRLVETEKVHIVAGVTSSAVAYAIRDYIDGVKVPLVIMGAAGADGLTAGAGSKFIFRTSFTNRQFNAPFGPYICKERGYKRIAILAADFVTGHEQTKGFADTYEKSGCTVVKKIMVPMGTKDFTPFLAQIPKSGIDAVWGMFLGGDAIGFVKTYAALGLKSKYPLIGSAGLAYEPLLPAMGDAAVGIEIPTWYVPSLPGKMNADFVKSFTADYKAPPGSATAGAYAGAMAVAEAIRKVNGNVEDTDGFLKALRAVSLKETPQGPFRFDDKQNVVFNLYAAKVEKQGQAFNPIIVKQIATEVTQNWN